MAGFLDAKERVIDVVLTGVGKSLLSKGDLNFVYWMPFDDEVDYEPFIHNSASLSASALTSSMIEKTEDPLIREAAYGYRYVDGAVEDRTNVNRPLFTVSSGKKIVPAMQVSGLSSSGSVEISVNQQQKILRMIEKVDGDILSGVSRQDSTMTTVELSYDDATEFSEGKLEGFLVTTYVSSSDGYVEFLHNRDSRGNIVYRNDLQLKIGD